MTNPDKLFESESASYVLRADGSIVRRRTVTYFNGRQEIKDYELTEEDELPDIKDILDESGEAGSVDAATPGDGEKVPAGSGIPIVQASAYESDGADDEGSDHNDDEDGEIPIIPVVSLSLCAQQQQQRTADTGRTNCPALIRTRSGNIVQADEPDLETNATQLLISDEQSTPIAFVVGTSITGVSPVATSSVALVTGLPRPPDPDCDVEDVSSTDVSNEDEGLHPLASKCNPREHVCIICFIIFILVLCFSIPTIIMAIMWYVHNQSISDEEKESFEDYAGRINDDD